MAPRHASGTASPSASRTSSRAQTPRKGPAAADTLPFPPEMPLLGDVGVGVESPSKAREEVHWKLLSSASASEVGSSRASDAASPPRAPPLLPVVDEEWVESDDDEDSSSTPSRASSAYILSPEALRQVTTPPPPPAGPELIDAEPEDRSEDAPVEGAPSALEAPPIGEASVAPSAEEFVVAEIVEEQAEEDVEEQAGEDVEEQAGEDVEEPAAEEPAEEPVEEPAEEPAAEEPAAEEQAGEGVEEQAEEPAAEDYPISGPAAPGPDPEGAAPARVATEAKGVSGGGGAALRTEGGATPHGQPNRAPSAIAVNPLTPVRGEAQGHRRVVEIMGTTLLGTREAIRSQMMSRGTLNCRQLREALAAMSIASFASTHSLRKAMLVEKILNFVFGDTPL